MKLKLKPIKEQVIAVVGASSGMGLRVAQLAAQRGARVALISRNEEPLKEAVINIEKNGGRAIYAVADASDFSQLDAAANKVLSSYGTIDSWVHIAGVGVWGMTEEIPLEDARRLFDINFWGVVHGTRIAREVMREKGGAIINMGSVESERALPLHSFYAASKHAIKGFTEAVRMEMEKQGIPISLTLIKPASINTPFVEHSRNYMPDASPRLMPPVYNTDVAARAILECCSTPYRDVTIGSSGRFIETMERVSPRFLDRFFETMGFRQQQRQDMPIRSRDNLDGPTPNEGFVHGMHDGYVQKTSLTTYARMHPFRATFILASVVGLGSMIWNSMNSRRQGGARYDRDLTVDVEVVENRADFLSPGPATL